MKLSARERGLQEVGGVQRSLRGSGAHQRVKLVDEQDDLPFRPRDLFQDRLEPLFELTAILRPREKSAEVQRDHAAVLEPLGHVAAHDPLRQPLHDGGLSHPGLPDEDRIVLGAPREHLDDAPDLLVAPDDRIELSLARGVREIARVLLERLIFLLGIRIGHLLSSPDAHERFVQTLPRGARLAQDASRLGSHGGVHHRQEQMLRAHELIL